MVRLLIILGGPLDIGGAERQLTMVLPELRGLGFRIELLLLAGEGALVPELARRGIDITLVPAPWRHCSGVAGRKLRAIAGLFTMVRRIRRSRPDIVHFFSPTAYALGGLVSLMFPHLIRVTSRRGSNDYLSAKPYTQRLERFLHRRMTALLANSQAAAAELREEGAAVDRIGVIYNAVRPPDASLFPGADEIRQRYALPLDALVLVVVANLWPYKGHADLLEALAGFAPPGEWRLLLAGRDEGEAGALATLAAGYGIARRVLFLGPVSEIEPLLLAADIGVLPSHQEGLSNALLEYMAAGLPVVATDVGGNAEALGDVGVIVPAHDPAALRRALETLVPLPRRREMGEAARARAAEFDLHRCSDAYQRLYRGLIDGKGTPADLRYLPRNGDAPRSQAGDRQSEVA